MKHTTVDDLLMDDTFLAWYHRSDENAVRMWNEWIAASPDNRRLVKEAVLLLDMLILKEQGPSDQQIQKAVSRMEARARAEKNRRKSTFKNNYRDMLQNYFKISMRHLLKNKAYSLINIGGLSIGMAVTILIALWIWDELSYNKNHKNYDRIAQVMQNQVFNGQTETSYNQAMQLAPVLRNEYGNNFKHVVMSSWPEDHTFSYSDKKLSQSGNFMEPGAPGMLTLKMLEGARSGLQDPHSILLSESMAVALFGNVDPMNKVITLDNRLEVKVTGVYADLPQNSSFAGMSYIAPWQLKVQAENLEKRVTWGNNWFRTFVQVADHADMSKVSAIIKDVKKNNINADEGLRFNPELFLHPMSRWHLFSEFKSGVNTGGAIQYVWLFGIIGLFVLLLACINFMNLSTARSEKRAKEVGIRKAVGSVRGQLIGQFYSESILVALLAFIFSLLLAQLLLPFFNEVAGKEIKVLWSNPFFWLAGIGCSFITGFIAGSYPALYLSAFNPVKVLKGTFKAGRLAAIPRKALVVLQFTVSIALITGTIIVFRQVQFAKNRPVGYDRNGLVTVPIKTKKIREHFDVFRNDLLNTGAVEEIAATDVPVTETYVTNSGFDWKGKDPGMQEEFVTMRVTHEFGKTVNWQIKEGRDFSRQLATDSVAFILNEAAAKYMGFKDPIGETIRWGKTGQYKVVGVIKDLVTQSPYTPAKQTIFFINYARTSFVNIKINPQASAAAAIDKIEAVFKKYDPENPFEYRFADQEFAKKFRGEVRIGKLASFFAILAVFISCLGLFGLASYVAEQRTKEIGVRKVLGATVLNVWRLLTKDFVLLVIISLLIAIPVSYYFMHGWLQEYQYRAPLSWWIFAAAGLGALVITILTVSFQAIKAAVMNPVKSLRTE